MTMTGTHIVGDWYDGKTSQKCIAHLHVDAMGTVVIRDAESQTVLLSIDYLSLIVSSRLANTPRYVKAKDGGVFETLDNTAIDALQKSWQPSFMAGLVHTLESHLAAVFMAVALIGVFIWGMAQFGIPASANVISKALPANVLSMLSKETMLVLDKTHFTPSEMTETEQENLQNQFETVLTEYTHLDLKVEFRHGGESVGANAFALPDGTIIFTDEIVELAENNDQLITILAHEIGHVAERHSLRSMIESSALGIGFLMLVGDVSTAGEMLLGLPVLLKTLAYSRAHETEADVFSGEYLDRHDISREAFVAIMRSLQKNSECNSLISRRESSENEGDVESDDASMNTEDVNPLSKLERESLCETLLAEKADDEDSWYDYFSTHPGMDERLEAFVH